MKRFLSRLFHLLQNIREMNKMKKGQANSNFRKFYSASSVFSFSYFCSPNSRYFLLKGSRLPKVKQFSYFKGSSQENTVLLYFILMSKCHLQKNLFLVCLCDCSRFSNTPLKNQQKRNLGFQYDRGNFFFCFIIFILVFNNIL